VKRKHRPFLLKHKILSSIIVMFSLLIVVVFFNHYSIQKAAKNLIYSNIENVPHRKTAVLLGMEKKFKNGKINRFYINRIDATVKLYNAKKIDVIIVSRNQGNVVHDVKKDLVRRGIPKNKIILDHAGLRTYDSMYRMYKVYGQKEFIVIAQHKQNERAIYIAKKNGLNAIAFNAGEYSGYNSFRLNMIEKLERTRLFFEFLVNKKPKYSGEKVTITF
jgi:SanA protein